MLILPEDITCGYFDGSEFEDLTVSPQRTVTKYEIEFYLEDAGETVADNKTYRIFKDHIQIAKPGQRRHSQLPFSTMYLKFSADGALADKLKKAPEYFRSNHPDSIKKQLEEIILLLENADDSLILYSRLLSVLHLILRDAELPKTYNARNHEIVSAAKAFMKAHYAEPIRLGDIAAAVNLSSTYFHNIFSADSGCSPHAYLIDVRISEAKKMLWDTTVGISEIAEKCGFGCQQYMNKIFKQQTGMSPGAYRKTFQQNYWL